MVNLFTNGLCTDMTLIVENGVRFECHKAVLIARSPMMAAMFSHEENVEFNKREVRCLRHMK
jgi:hypothetical protein